MSDEVFVNQLDFKRTTVAEARRLELLLERGPTRRPIAVRLAAPSAASRDSDLFASDERVDAARLLDVLDCAAPFTRRRARADQLRVVAPPRRTLAFGPLYSMCLVLATGSVAALALVYVLLFVPGEPPVWAALPDAHPLRAPLKLHAQLVLAAAASSLGAPLSVLWRAPMHGEPVRQLLSAYGAARTLRVATCDRSTAARVLARLGAAPAPHAVVFESACDEACQHALTDLLDESQRRSRVVLSAVVVLLGCGDHNKLHDRLMHRIKHEVG